MTILDMLQYLKDTDNDEPNGVEVDADLIDGEGIREVADKVKDKAKRIGYTIKNFGKLRSNIPPTSRKVLDKYGEQSITAATICRKPLSGVLEKVIRGLAKNIDHDRLFHLSIRFNLANGVEVLFEKNSVVNIAVVNSSMKDMPEGSECRDVNGVSNKNLTLNDVIEKTREYMGNHKFTTYHPIRNNCQVFIKSVVEANGFNTDMDFILQDVQNSFSKISKKFMKTVTDTANAVNHIVHGEGAIPSYIHPLSNIEIDEYYKNDKFYIGTRLKDQIPHILLKNKAFIMNMAKSNDPGTHWVALVNNNNLVSYYDSYGLPPPVNVLNMMKRSSKHIYFNNLQNQKADSVTCGYFCIYYIDNIFKKVRDEIDVLSDLTNGASNFNERLVVDYVRKENED